MFTYNIKLRNLKKIYISPDKKRGEITIYACAEVRSEVQHLLCTEKEVRERFTN